MPDEVATASLPAAPATAPVIDTGNASPAAEGATAAPKVKLTPSEAGQKAQEAAKVEAVKAKEDAAKPEVQPEAKPEKTDAATAKARELVKSGDIQGAMAAIGLNPEKLTGESWGKWRRYADNVAKKISATAAAAEAKETEVRTLAEQLVKDHEPLVRARKAYSEGEYEEAFQLAFGEELNSFQKKALQKLANPGAGKDPAVLALRKEISDLRAEREAEQRKALETQNVRSLEEKRAAYRQELSQQLASLDDATISANAETPEFLADVFEVQRRSYDARNDTHMSAQEAAEQVIEHYRQIADRASKFLGGPAPASPSAGSPPALSPAKPTTSLSSKEAAEAVGATKLRGRALIEYHVNRAAK